MTAITDLDPFTQGAVEVALKSSRALTKPSQCPKCRLSKGWMVRMDEPSSERGGFSKGPDFRCAECKTTQSGIPCTFSDLAPETLARIVEDCAAHERAYPLMAHDPRRRNRGKNFWKNRQAGMWTKSGWPPVRLYLADDGLIHISTEGDA